MTQHPKELLRYRRATMADREVIQQITLGAYGGYKSVLEPEHWKKMEDRLADAETTIRLLEQATAFICEYDGTAAGGIYVMPSKNPTALFSADWAYIRILSVLPQYRGLGIATGLMKLCIEFARSSGEQVLALHTAAYQAAWPIYERLGFERVKDLGLLLGKEYWLYVLNLKQNIYA